MTAHTKSSIAKIGTEIVENFPMSTFAISLLVTVYKSNAFGVHKI